MDRQSSALIKMGRKPLHPTRFEIRTRFVLVDLPFSFTNNIAAVFKWQWYTASHLSLQSDWGNSGGTSGPHCSLFRHVKHGWWRKNSTLKLNLSIRILRFYKHLGIIINYLLPDRQNLLFTSLPTPDGKGEPNWNMFAAISTFKTCLYVRNWLIEHFTIELWSDLCGNLRQKLHLFNILNGARCFALTTT
jgi:hypothetical protein